MCVCVLHTKHINFFFSIFNLVNLLTSSVNCLYLSSSSGILIFTQTLVFSSMVFQPEAPDCLNSWLCIDVAQKTVIKVFCLWLLDWLCKYFVFLFLNQTTVLCSLFLKYREVCCKLQANICYITIDTKDSNIFFSPFTHMQIKLFCIMMHTGAQIFYYPCSILSPMNIF